MANTSSAKKANRAAARRGVFNARRKKAMKETIKEFSKFIALKKGKDAAGFVGTVYKAIDKAAKNGTIKKNTAARMKSRVMRHVKALTS